MRISHNKPFTADAPLTKRFPITVLEFGNDNQRDKIHPTQKPLTLCEYLIRTYSNDGDTVLDSCMGSGTTGVAAKGLGRSFIGIEKDKTYYEAAKQRIRQTTGETDAT